MRRMTPVRAMILVVGLMALVFLVGVGWGHLRVTKMRAQTAKIGDKLGFVVMVPPAPKQVMWVGGAWQGRPAGLSHPALPTRRYDHLRGRSATDWIPGTRIAVGVRKSLGPIKVYRTFNEGVANPDQPFEEAFPVREGDQVLTDAGRRALVAFVQEHGGLRLQARDQLHPLPYGAGILHGVPAVLVHDTLGMLDLGAVRVRLDALAELASVLEAP